MTVVTTFVGYIVPILMLLYIRRTHDPFQYFALAAFSIFMGTIGMGKLLPFFGHSVVGGSLYFPTALIAMSMAGFYIRDERIMRRIGAALILGCTFLMIGASRWLVFAAYGGEYTTHDYTANFNFTFASAIMLFKVYLATMMGVLLSKWKPRCEALLVVPAIIEIIPTTPLAIYTAWRLTGDNTVDWNEVAVWTMLVRLSLPVAFGALLYVLPTAEFYDDHEYQRDGSGGLRRDGREHQCDGARVRPESGDGPEVRQRSGIHKAVTRWTAPSHRPD